MQEESGFAELLMRIRAGDNDACAELERRYGDTLQRMARVRLRFYDLQRRVNPSDVVQSVLALFFTRAAGGHFSFETPEDVLKLLKTMVERKVNDHRKKDRTQKRGGGAVAGSDLDGIPDSGPSPSEAIAEQELFQKLWDGLEPDERDLAHLVVWDRLSWQEVADRLGVQPDAARKRYNRLLEKARTRWAEGSDHE